MIFQKNRFLADTCIFASVLLSAILVGLSLLLFSVETPDMALTVFVVFFQS